MPRIAEQARPVTGGVDTHADVHVAAAVDQVGRVLGTEAFPAVRPGTGPRWRGCARTASWRRWGWRAPAATVPGWPATWPPAALRWSR